MRNLPHDSAVSHVSGKSEYIDDRPLVQGELHLDVFYSPFAKAKIKKLNLENAKSAPGVRGVFTAKDLHHNQWGTIFQDQPLLAEEITQFAGEAIAIIAADSLHEARSARNLIEATFEELTPILSIDAAKKAKSYIGTERSIERGEVEANLKSAPHKLEKQIVIHGADHFYLESQAAVAYPQEDGNIEVHSSAQHPTEVQHVVAHALGLSYHQVVCIVKRMGGAFGGKESQAAPFAAYAALVAQKLGRAARIILTKDDDMIMTGKRNPFQNDYRVGFDDQGKILALDVRLYSDGGAYADLSTSIMERAMLHTDNAYFIPHMKVTGQVCRTNFHPHTAFRGFGGPKGVATIERIIEEIAHALKKDPLEIRKLNCYREGSDITHYGQKVENNLLPELFDTLEKDCDYKARRQAIEAHNKTNTKTLRGLSLTPVKFGISFTTRFLNQANALVIVHRDGTVQVSTGATEMGQGVNARIATIVAEELGLPRDQVRVMATSTEKNGNTSPTAASSGTDLNGAAAQIAAKKIKTRLAEIASKLFDLPEARWAKNAAGLGTESELTADSGSSFGVEFKDGFAFDAKKRKIKFADLVNEAYLNRISLSEYAHYRFPNLDFNKITGKGRAFLYYTQGTAASEVEIDAYTGEVKVRRVDILMDLGRPINEGLDIGQVSGAFIQGMGWVTTEKLHYDKNGMLKSHSPSTYKIPNVQDTPRVFNMRLIDNPHNTVNVKATKAVGEPPLLLSISVWTAIHDALKGLPQYKSEYPKMELPATQEEIFRALNPELIAKWEV
jgi:xanthine dehydrogenase large subunit